MNIYTNPSEQLTTSTALQRLQLQHQGALGSPDGQAESEVLSHSLHLAEEGEEDLLLLASGGEVQIQNQNEATDDLHYSDIDLDIDNIKNQQLEEAEEYLEPQVCMAHRPLPEVTPEVRGQVPEVKVKPNPPQVKRKPQRFVRPRSPRPLNPPTDRNATSDDLETAYLGHHYEDAETDDVTGIDDVIENEYAEIPGDNIYETLDEMKKSLATIGETQA